MKVFDRLDFDLAQCRVEVGELRDWLDANPTLVEKSIRDFFRRRRHLSAFIASYNANVNRFDRIAFEYPLFGDFTCDLVVGDSAGSAFCFVEFEDAGPQSLFARRGKKVTREWSPRFDHGYSQIIDWFHKLDDMRKSSDYSSRFGAPVVRHSGVLVVGRDHFLNAGERERLVWQSDNVVVASRTIQCTTFDGLAEILQARLDLRLRSFQAGG
jgi:hypothetical protein